MSEATVKQTHGALGEFVGQDGIKRTMSVNRYDNGYFRIVLRTWWDGEDGVPMETSVGLGDESFNVLSNLMLEFGLNRNLFALPDDKAEA